MVMDACIKSGQADKAAELFEAMQLDGVEPGSVSFNVFILAYAKVGATDALWLKSVECLPGA